MIENSFVRSLSYLNERFYSFEYAMFPQADDGNPEETMKTIFTKSVAACLLWPFYI
jgi:hypothetical protein